MALSFIGAGYAGASATITIPTHQAGDLLLIFAHRTNSTTAPTLPAGWTPIYAVEVADSSTIAQRAGYKIAASDSETSGSWTNATQLHAHVYRGQHGTTPIGASRGDKYVGSPASIIYAALTLNVTDGTSWVVGMVGNRTTSALNYATPPTGMVVRVDPASRSGSHDTNGGVSSWSQQTVSLGGNADNIVGVIEIIAAATGASAALTGTITASTTEADIVAGGKTIVLTLTGDTFISN